MLANICSRQQKQTEFSDEFFAGILRANKVNPIASIRQNNNKPKIMS